MCKFLYELKDTLLRVDGVTAERGGNVILAGVDVAIRDIVRPDKPGQGQVVGVLGPSGIGKTTLFRILAGLDAPASAASPMAGILAAAIFSAHWRNYPDEKRRILLAR